MKQPQIGLNETASLNRPAWTSMTSTGGLEAYKHLHTGLRRIGDEPIKKNYFERGMK